MVVGWAQLAEYKQLPAEMVLLLSSRDSIRQVVAVVGVEARTESTPLAAQARRVRSGLASQVVRVRRLPLLVVARGQARSMVPERRVELGVRQHLRLTPMPGV